MPSSFRRASIMGMGTSWARLEPSSDARFLEAASGTYGFAAEFGANLVHRPFRRGALFALRVHQAGGIGIVGRRQVGKAHAQKAKARAVRLTFQGCARSAEDAVGQLGRRVQR